jgi:autotransporter-associated beta strand protein
MRKTLLLILLPGSFLFAGTSYTWNVNGNGTWDIMANWTPSTAFPNAIDDAATFGSVLTTGSATITLGQNITIGSLTFDNVLNYSIAAGNNLTFSTSGSNGTITVTALSGSPTIACPLVLASNLTITQNSAGGLTISGLISNSPSVESITLNGTQTTTFSNAGNTFGGGITISSGVLKASADGALGDATTGTLTIQAGTFQAGGNFSTASTRTVSLTGSASIDSNGNTLTIQGPINGSGSLNKIGSGTLILSNTGNSYASTAINVGTLQVSSDSNLGTSGGAVSIASGAVLQAGGSFSSSRSLTLAGTSTIDTQANTLTWSGSIGGSGSLTKIGTGQLTLSGSNSFSGGITISAGTLQGNTSSLPGNITHNGTSLIFNQTSSGTYSSQVSGAGAMTINGGSTLTMSGSNTSFTGSTLVTGSTTLVVSGSLANSSLITVNSGSTLSGSGTVSSVSNSGTIVPGTTGSGTLTISGNLTMNANSAATVAISPTSNGEFVVTGTATLGGNGVLTVNPSSGFYGLSAQYTLLSANSLVGTFSSAVVSDPNFIASFTYPSNTVLLTVQVLRPFQDFAFANKNEEAVGNNIDALNAAGLINSDMTTVINSLVGSSTSAIDTALDQMHPAALSAFAELQGEIGGQVLTIFHRAPTLLCGCVNSNRIWVEPYGNWLQEKHQGEQIGFHATTRGIAFGVDHEFFDAWTLGIGGSWNDTHLSWSKHRGHAYIKGLYGALYTDLRVGNFYFGGSAYGGTDWFHTARSIQFTTIDRQAKAEYEGLDIGAQFSSAYYFGTPACLFYPYGIVDYLFLDTDPFSESGANSLDLSVERYKSATLRSEAGLALQVIDKNYRETICISPMFAMGWVMEWPLERDKFRSTFAGQTIPFSVEGWDQTWQLLNLRFGLSLTYYCWNLDSLYIAEISPEGNSPLFNQRANFRLSRSC